MHEDSLGCLLPIKLEFFSHGWKTLSWLYATFGKSFYQMLPLLLRNNQQNVL
jgi:hypothetical protein